MRSPSGTATGGQRRRPAGGASRRSTGSGVKPAAREQPDRGVGASSSTNAASRPGSSLPDAASSCRPRASSHASTARPIPRPRHCGSTPPSRNARTTRASPGAAGRRARRRGSRRRRRPRRACRARGPSSRRRTRSSTSSADGPVRRAVGVLDRGDERARAPGTSARVSGRHVRPGRGRRAAASAGAARRRARRWGARSVVGHDDHDPAPPAPGRAATEIAGQASMRLRSRPSAPGDDEVLARARRRSP